MLQVFFIENNVNNAELLEILDYFYQINYD